MKTGTLSQNRAMQLGSPSQVLFQPLAIHFFLVQCRQKECVQYPDVMSLFNRA